MGVMVDSAGPSVMVFVVLQAVRDVEPVRNGVRLGQAVKSTKIALNLGTTPAPDPALSKLNLQIVDQDDVDDDYIKNC